MCPFTLGQSRLIDVPLPRCRVRFQLSLHLDVGQAFPVTSPLCRTTRPLLLNPDVGQALCCTSTCMQGKFTLSFQLDAGQEPPFSSSLLQGKSQMVTPFGSRAICHFTRCRASCHITGCRASFSMSLHHGARQSTACPSIWIQGKPLNITQSWVQGKRLPTPPPVNRACLHLGYTAAPSGESR